MNAPHVHAFLLCDQIIRDMQTGYPTLINVFQVVTGPTLPGVKPFWCYARLSEGGGTYDCRFRIIDSISRQTLREISHPIKWDDRDYLDVFLQIPDFTIERYGAYEIELEVGDQTFARSIMHVKPR